MKHTHYFDKTEFRFAWLCQILKQLDLLVWFFTLGRYDSELLVVALCYDSVSEWFNAVILKREEPSHDR